jgi:hypothetical protein
MKDTFQMECAMDMEEVSQAKVKSTKVGLRMIRWKELASLLGLMVVYLRESINRVRSKAREDSLKQMDRSMKETSKTTFAAVLESSTTLMESVMKALGVKVKRMGKEVMFSQMVLVTELFMQMVRRSPLDS